MGNSPKTWPRSQRRGTLSKRWRAFLAAVLGSAVLMVRGDSVGLLGEPPPVQSPSGSGAQVSGIDAPIELRRPNFNYSVIPGGAFDGHELESADNRDTVVAEHYRDVDLSTIEPDLMELFALTDTGPGLGSWPINTFSRLGAGEPADVETTMATAPQFGFPLSLPFDVSASPVEPIGVGPIDTEPGSSNLPGPGPGVGTPPLVLFPTGPGFSVDAPSAFDGLDSLLDAPLPQRAPNAPNPSPLPGPEPVSVPDPASTMALLVIGLTAMALAKRRN